MIAPLRHRHRHTWLALAIVLPAIVLTAASTRRAPAWMERLPAELSDRPDSIAEPLAHARGDEELRP